MKKCTKCGEQKPLSEFHKDKTAKMGIRSICKKCYSSFHANYYENNTKKVKEKNKKQWLKRKYNMEVTEFERIKTSQNSCCGICKTKLEDGHLVHVDHDHKTGKVRGILCRWCNTGLGNFKDSLSSLKSALSYLEKYSSKDGPENT
jgi:hypothetical protein